MRVFYLIILLFISLNTFSQTSVSGIVLDQDETPIDGVVIQYGDFQQDYGLSDKDGKFIIPEKHKTIIHIMSIGYKTKSMLVSDIRKNNVIILESAPIELSPIEVTPTDANKILSQAIYNTKAHLLTKTNIEYLLHLKQVETNSQEEQEFYVKYLSCLNKNEPKKKGIPYKFKMMEWDIIKKLPEKGSSEILSKNIFNIEYHLIKIDGYYFKDNYKVIVADSPENLIILSAKPKEGKFKDCISFKFYISQDDTTFVSWDIDENYRNIEKEYKSFRTFKYKINKIKTDIQFVRDNQNYYMSNCSQIVEASVIHKNKKEENLVFYSNSIFTGNINTQKTDDLKSLNGGSKQVIKMCLTRKD